MTRVRIRRGRQDTGVTAAERAAAIPREARISPARRAVQRISDQPVSRATAILADAVIRVVMAYTLPVGLVPGLGGALWPVTFLVLQVVTNVYFARSGFWRILLTGVSF
jgi:hypothetical protein